MPVTANCSVIIGTPLLHELLQGSDQLVNDGVIPLTDAIGHAGADVGGQQLLAEAVEGGADGGDLDQDIRAVGVLLQHLPQATDLSLDAVEAMGEFLLLLVGAVLCLMAAAVHTNTSLGYNLMVALYTP